MSMSEVAIIPQPAWAEAGEWIAPGVETSGLKVALVHDWLTGMRGGEKALEALCSMFPAAPLWTLVHVPGSVSAAIEAREIHTSFLQHLPFAKTKYRHYLPLFPMAAELTKVSARDADVIVYEMRAREPACPAPESEIGSAARRRARRKVEVACRFKIA